MKRKRKWEGAEDDVLKDTAGPLQSRKTPEVISALFNAASQSARSSIVSVTKHIPLLFSSRLVIMGCSGCVWHSPWIQTPCSLRGCWLWMDASGKEHRDCSSGKDPFRAMTTLAAELSAHHDDLWPCEGKAGGGLSNWCSSLSGNTAGVLSNSHGWNAISARPEYPWGRYLQIRLN